MDYSNLKAQKEDKHKYRITVLVLFVIIFLLIVAIFCGCRKTPLYRNEVNLSFPVDSLVNMTDQDLTEYLDQPTSDFDTMKSWLVSINGQRYIIWQSPNKIEIIK